MEVIKDVTRNAYYDYSVGDLLPFSYRNSNTYDNFVNHTTPADMIQTLLYTESIVYISFIAAILFTGFALLREEKAK